MVLNYIWIAFFVIAFLFALCRLFGYWFRDSFETLGWFFDIEDAQVFSEIIDSTFSMSKLSFEISIGLTGILCLWMGIMKIGENGGAVNLLAKVVNPFFNKLFPELPENSPARGSMMLNFAANMLGLDNAATPMGLKAMKEMQESNDKKDKASNSQIMFLVLNTSGLTLIPVTVMAYRAQFGAENAADIFLPILLSTYIATLAGLLIVSFYQKINLFNKTVLAYLIGTGLLITGLFAFFSSLPKEEMELYSKLFSSFILFGIIIFFIILAIRKKVNVYESFIDGAKDGFSIAVKIIPYLVAILVSIAVFRASGAMEYLVVLLECFFGLFIADVSFVEGVPTALMKPLSGSGARGLMLESFETHGVDSFVGKLTSTLQGATDTTFYIIAVYFGSVGIKKTRYAIKAGLLADFFGIVAAIAVCYMFFGNTKDVITNEGLKDKISILVSNSEEEKLRTYFTENITFYDLTEEEIYEGKQVLSYFDQLDSAAAKWQDVSVELKGDDEKFIELKSQLFYKRNKKGVKYHLYISNGKITKIKYFGIMKYEKQIK